MKIKKKASIGIFVVALCNFAWSLTATASSFFEIDLTGIPQQGDYWCWAACAEMSGKHEEPSSTRNQQNIMVKFKGSALADEPGSIEETVLAAEYVCHNICDYTYTAASMMGEFYISQLVHDHAAIVGLVLSNSTGNSGHMGVVTAMAVANDGTKFITYYDPATDNLSAVSYSSFLTGSQTQYRYLATVYTPE